MKQILSILTIGALVFALAGSSEARGRNGGSAPHGGRPSAPSHGGFHGGFQGHRGAPSHHNAFVAPHRFDGRRHHGGFFRGHGGVFIGAAPFIVGPAFAYGYGYGYDPGYVYSPPPVYSAPAQSYWYYCPSAGGYYPDVPSCPEPWVPVTPQ